jgi:peptidoglycan/LPS O-acetylase OafA/YrhL
MPLSIAITTVLVVSLTRATPQSGRSSGADRLPALTGLRFVAATAVFANHAGLESVFRSDTANFVLAGATASLAQAAVAFFFMLSGFVLTWSARPDDTPGHFWRRRAAKVLPNHVVTWTAGLLLMLAVSEPVPLGHVLPSLGLVQAWIPVIPIIEGTNGPSWSLACEALFYLSFPFLAPLIARIRPERLWLASGGLCLGIIVVPFISLLLPYEPTLFGLPAPFWRVWFTVFLPPVRLLDFALGIVIARIVLSGRWPRIRPVVAVLAGVLAWGVSLALPVPFGLIAPFVVPLMLLLGSCCQLRTALGGPTMVRLGELSFAFYLVHWLVLHYAHVALGGGQYSASAAVGFLVAAFVVTLVLSSLLNHVVERPAMRRLGRPKSPTLQEDR